MRRFDCHFEIVPTFWGRIAFACLEHFDFASLHLLTIYFDRAEGHDDATIRAMVIDRMEPRFRRLGRGTAAALLAAAVEQLEFALARPVT